jgi:glutathione synthase/RimK-type ligase-like ATP-grasp enzyme
MIKAAVLVPAPDYPENWDWTYDVEADALTRAGIAVEPVPWTDPGDLARFDIVLPLVAWGYQSDPARWFDLLDTLERAGRCVVNPVPVLRWNTDKVYLEEVEAAGVPTVPTRVVETLDGAAIAAARRDFGPELVIKPPISASAYGTHRLSASDPVPRESVGRRMMIQPFLRSVTDEGEYSLIYFDGVFSHAVVKRARSGDYRVQPHLGGTEVKCDPPEGSRRVAEAALNVAPEQPAYARVDLIRLDDGRLGVIELELIEPSLWLDHAPDQGESFAAAVVARVRQQELAKR